MADYIDDGPEKRSSRTLVMIVLALLIILLAGAVLWALNKESGSEATRNDTNNTQQIDPDNTRTSPDAVKDSGSPNSDTQPSGTGTGPGSDNSLLSQPPTQ